MEGGINVSEERPQQLQQPQQQQQVPQVQLSSESGSSVSSSPVLFTSFYDEYGRHFMPASSEQARRTVLFLIRIGLIDVSEKFELVMHGQRSQRWADDGGLHPYTAVINLRQRMRSLLRQKAFFSELTTIEICFGVACSLLKFERVKRMQMHVPCTKLGLGSVRHFADLVYEDAANRVFLLHFCMMKDYSRYAFDMVAQNGIQHARSLCDVEFRSSRPLIRDGDIVRFAIMCFWDEERQGAGLRMVSSRGGVKARNDPGDRGFARPEVVIDDLSRAMTCASSEQLETLVNMCNRETSRRYTQISGRSARSPSLFSKSPDPHERQSGRSKISDDMEEQDGDNSRYRDDEDDGEDE
eukprot:ANDGO_04182.mRNA.1 hypothetical protein